MRILLLSAFFLVALSRQSFSIAKSNSSGFGVGLCSYLKKSVDLNKGSGSRITCYKKRKARARELEPIDFFIFECPFYYNSNLFQKSHNKGYPTNPYIGYHCERGPPTLAC